MCGVTNKFHISDITMHTPNTSLHFDYVVEGVRYIPVETSFPHLHFVTVGYAM